MRLVIITLNKYTENWSHSFPTLYKRLVRGGALPVLRQKQSSIYSAARGISILHRSFAMLIITNLNSWRTPNIMKTKRYIQFVFCTQWRIVPQICSSYGPVQLNRIRIRYELACAILNTTVRRANDNWLLWKGCTGQPVMESSIYISSPD